MPVVAFNVAREPRSVLTEVFCVQSYWQDRAKLVEGRAEQFGTMEAALRAGKRAAARSPFVRVFRVRGNVEADYWERPVTVASFGELVGEAL